MANAKDPAVLDSTLRAIERQYGKNAIVTLEGASTASGEEKFGSISTGSIGLDLATGIGGYPKGRVVELFGPESSGKTTLALHAIVTSQEAGGVACFIDTDHTLDAAYARAIGVDLQKLLVSQPDTGEQAFEIAEVLARSGAVDLIVLDSVPNMRPRAIVEGEASADDAGIAARLMSQALRKLTAIAYRTGTVVLFVNGTIHRTSTTFALDGLTGGNALKFYASMRIEVSAARPEAAWKCVKVKLAKNKCGPPFTDAEFFIRHGEGIDTAGESFDLGILRGIIETNGEVFTFGGATLGKNRETARHVIQGKVDLAATLRAAILAAPVRS